MDEYEKDLARQIDDLARADKARKVYGILDRIHERIPELPSYELEAVRTLCDMERDWPEDAWALGYVVNWLRLRREQAKHGGQG
jgi:hypothetical protein